MVDISSNYVSSQVWGGGGQIQTRNTVLNAAIVMLASSIKPKREEEIKKPQKKIKRKDREKKTAQ